MRFFLDTNILVDLLLRRDPHLQAAVALLDLSIEEDITYFISSHCIATTHYVCKKAISETELRKLLAEILDLVNVVSIDEEILRKSLKSHHRDLEDAIQIFCAHQIKRLDGIITRNLRDFSTSEISVFSPDEALRYIKNKIETS